MVGKWSTRCLQSVRCQAWPRFGWLPRKDHKVWGLKIMAPAIVAKVPMTFVATLANLSRIVIDNGPNSFESCGLVMDCAKNGLCLDLVERNVSRGESGGGGCMAYKPWNIIEFAWGTTDGHHRVSFSSSLVCVFDVNCTYLPPHTKTKSSPPKRRKQGNKTL